MLVQNGRDKRESVRWIVAILAFGLLQAVPAAADEESMVKRLRGERLAANGRCEEALPLLAQARQGDPSDARAALVAGQCELRLKRYPAATATLSEAQRLAPNDGEVALHLGMARFHDCASKAACGPQEIAGIEQALGAAEPQLSGRPELELYLGILDLLKGRHAQAGPRFQAARAGASDRLDPVASYYEGWTAARLGQRAAAREDLQRVIAQHPNSEWAQRAAVLLGGFRDSRPATWWVEGTVGMEYDDNVVLAGSGVQLDPGEISSQNDHRAVMSLEVGYELLRTPDWTLGVLGTFYGTAHDDLEDFNVQFPGISLWADRRLGDNDLARIQYDFGYAWFGGSEPYLAVQTLTPNFYRNWGTAGITRFLAAVEKRNFLFPTFDVPDGPGAVGGLCPTSQPCGPPGVNESSARNRDGWGFHVGFDHTLPIDEFFGRIAVGERMADANPSPGERNTRFFLRGGYRYHRYSARGSEYSYGGHEARLGVRMVLPLDFSLEITGSYERRDYRNRSTFPDPEDLFAVRFPSGTVRGLQYGLSGKDRKDDLAEIEVVLERPINDNLTLALRYNYTDDASNVDVFDYNREIIGVYATFRFSP